MAALTKSTQDILAKALQLNSTATAGTSDTFVLGLEQKGFIRDFLNRNNPLSAYTQMIDVADTGAGTITIKWDGADNAFEDKKSLGNGAIKGFEQKLEALLWNAPVFKSEGMSAYDIKKGALNTLAYRMEKSLVKFTQESIKRGFEAMAAKAKSGADISTATLDGTEANAKKTMFAIISEATKLVKDTQTTKADVIITVAPEVFDHLAMAGLIGDRVTQTFAGGQYSVATIGGYRIQSGEMFMPANVYALIALSNSVVSKIDVIAANTGKVELSNDLATYIELADINVVPGYVDAATPKQAFIVKMGTVARK